MCVVQVTKTANRIEISSLLEKILLKHVRWCLTFVGLYIYIPVYLYVANLESSVSKDYNIFSLLNHTVHIYYKSKLHSIPPRLIQDMNQPC